MPLSKEYILTLLKTPKIGPASIKTINRFSNFKVTSVDDLLDVIVDAKKAHPRIILPSKEDLLAANLYAQRIFDSCSNIGVTPISFNDENYPIKLMRLDDYPVMIYTKGAISAINSQYSVGVIGTREPSSYGIKAGRRISNIIARHGFSIISGLAIGCDTVGHLGALDANAPTVAVLASGVDIIYPKENQYLADRIIEQGGALFSEYEVGFRPQKSSFVERDRLQTGLSDGLVVIETDMQGGTMHAVKAAQKLNVPLGCISGHPESLQDFAKTRGTKYLIENGAASLGNVDQIFSFIQKLNPNITEFIPEDKSKEVNVNKVTIPAPQIKNITDPIPDIVGVTYDAHAKADAINVPAYTGPVGSARFFGGGDATKTQHKADSYIDLFEKIAELTDIMAQMLVQQESMAKMLANILEQQSTSKEKAIKQKRPKKEENHPKLL